jgi:hypothetical protein
MTTESATGAPGPSTQREDAAKPTKARRQPADGGSKLLEHRFFIVGLIWLALTIGLVLFVMFEAPLCDSLRINTFAAVFSISAGFLAWTFAGSINAKSRSLVPGVAIVATGGFAVFMIILSHFGPENMKTADPRCSGPSVQDGVARYFSEIGVHTSNVVQRLTEAKHDPALNAAVFEAALTLKTKIDSFPKKHLSELQKGVLALYGAQVTIALPITLNMDAVNASDAKTYAQQAVRYAEAAIQGLRDATAQDGEEGRNATEHVARYKSIDKARYISGLGKIIDLQWSTLGNLKPSYSEDQISTTFEPMTAGFLREISAANDPPMRWYCANALKRLPCTKL